MRSNESLAYLIEEGHRRTDISESHDYFLSYKSTKGWVACALGGAYVAMVGSPSEAYIRCYSRGIWNAMRGLRFLAEEFDTSFVIVQRINDLHIIGVPATTIATMVRTWPEPTEPKPSLFERLIAWLKIKRVVAT